MTRRVACTVHHYRQGKAILGVAADLGIDVELVSPAGCARSLGVEFFHQLARLLGRDVLIDCGDHQGDVMAAISLRTSRIRADCRADIQARLRSICAEADIELVEDLPEGLVDLRWNDKIDEIQRKLG